MNVGFDFEMSGKVTKCFVVKIVIFSGFPLPLITSRCLDAKIFSHCIYQDVSKPNKILSSHFNFRSLFSFISTKFMQNQSKPSSERFFDLIISPIS
jgi:hypothetical protein